MYERMALKWVLEHQFNFLRALLFVIMDLTSEVSVVCWLFIFSVSPSVVLAAMTSLHAVYG